jgi:hypothetical protein
LHIEIEEQLNQGDNGLLEEHRYLTEINPEDFDVALSEDQEYWLLAVHAARVACASRGVAETLVLPRLCPPPTRHLLDGHDYT